MSGGKIHRDDEQGVGLIRHRYKAVFFFFLHVKWHHQQWTHASLSSPVPSLRTTTTFVLPKEGILGF